MSLEENVPLPYKSKAKSISIAEFLETNRQMLGFSSPARNMLITVKEAVDNALDAAEDAEQLVNIRIEIKAIDKKIYTIEIDDNGPGIQKEKIGSVFGKLLYGSKFHDKKQKRGQQGLGISAVVLNSQIDTNKPAYVTVKQAHEQYAYSANVGINILKNQPRISALTKHKIEKTSGVKIRVTLKGQYITEGKRSIKYYLQQVSLMNPWANLQLVEPNGNVIVFTRTSERVKNPIAAKLYPSTMQPGIFYRLIRDSPGTLADFMETAIEGINDYIVTDLFKNVLIPPHMLCSALLPTESDLLHYQLKQYKYPICEVALALAGEKELLDAMRAHDYDFAVSATSAPLAFENTIAKFEMALVYGGPLLKEQKMEVSRFVNKVPLLLQPGSCLLHNGATKVNWKNYGLQQNKDELPTGPVRLIVHLAGFKIPFNSEAKESVADIPKLQTLYVATLKKLGLKLSKQLTKQLYVAAQKEKLSLMQIHVPVFCASLREHGHDIHNEIVLLSLVMNGVIWAIREDKIYFANYTALTYTIGILHNDVRTNIEVNRASIYVHPLIEGTFKIVCELSIYEINSNLEWCVDTYVPYTEPATSLHTLHDVPILQKLDTIIQQFAHQIRGYIIPYIKIRVRNKQNLLLHDKGYWTLGSANSIKSGKKVSGMVQLIRLIKLIEIIMIQLKANKTAALREVYYNTERLGKYYKFEDQQASDRYIEALEVITGESRQILGIFPEARGQIAGPVVISELTKRGPKESDCVLDLPDRGGGIPIPFSLEHFEIKSITGRFILAIETAGAFCRLVENGFHTEYNAILICLNGQPTRSTKELIKLLASHNLPVYTFLDSDNWSYRIHASCAYGSIKTAHLSQRFSVPHIVHLGLTYDDIVEYGLPTDKLKQVDIKGFEQLLDDPRFVPDVWHDVFRRQMHARVKAEQQSLAAKDINFVTEVYLPTKLRQHGVIS